MTPAQAADTLEEFNAWRRGDGPLLWPSPINIGVAIDMAVAELRKKAAREEQVFGAVRASAVGAELRDKAAREKPKSAQC